MRTISLHKGVIEGKILERVANLFIIIKKKKQEEEVLVNPE
jgi:hypothetical protein